MPRRRKWLPQRIEQLRREMDLTPQEFKRVRKGVLYRLIERKGEIRLLNFVTTDTVVQLRITEELRDKVYAEAGVAVGERRLMFLRYTLDKINRRGWYRWEPIDYRL